MYPFWIVSRIVEKESKLNRKKERERYKFYYNMKRKKVVCKNYNYRENKTFQMT